MPLSNAAVVSQVLAGVATRKRRGAGVEKRGAETQKRGAGSQHHGAGIKNIGKYLKIREFAKANSGKIAIS